MLESEALAAAVQNHDPNTSANSQTSDGFSLNRQYSQNSDNSHDILGLTAPVKKKVDDHEARGAVLLLQNFPVPAIAAASVQLLPENATLIRFVMNS